jgi:hypothetical protein
MSTYCVLPPIITSPCRSACPRLNKVAISTSTSIRGWIGPSCRDTSLFLSLVHTWMHLCATAPIMICAAAGVTEPGHLRLMAYATTHLYNSNDRCPDEG